MVSGARESSEKRGIYRVTTEYCTARLILYNPAMAERLSNNSLGFKKWSDLLS